MFYEIMAVARDWSIILLVLEGMAILAVPLFIMLKITQGLRKLKPHVAPLFRKVHHYFELANGVVQRGSLAVANPIAGAEAAYRGVEVSAKNIKRLLSKES
jgi:uncharacterized membrane protein YhfC